MTSVATQSHNAAGWRVTEARQPPNERCRSTSRSGRLAGDATTVAATNVVATVGMERESPPARGSIERVERRAQTRATSVAKAANTIDEPNRSARGAGSSGNASSNAVSAAQYASLIV